MSHNLNIPVIIIVILKISYSKTIELSDVCRVGWQCVQKCCPENHYISDEDCVEYNNTMDVVDVSKAFVYNENLEKTGKNLKDVFKMVKAEQWQEEEIALDDLNFQPYLLESGKLLVEINISNAAYDPILLDYDAFCVDYSETDDINSIVFRVTRPKKNTSTKVLINTIASFISSIFLALVVVVYSVFGSLRNLVGKIVMSLAASQMAGYITLVVLSLSVTNSESLKEEFCLSANFCFYFFFLASFFWMNIFSYDIWKQFRSKELRSFNEERGEDRRKFVFYSIYAWGTPLIMAIAVICIELDFIDVRGWPRFIKPNIISNRCFLREHERLYYLYTPMLILIGTNWIFFSITGYMIWQTKRACHSMGMRSTPNNIKQRLVIFLRLSLVMGISWVLEVISSMKPNLPIWYITDLYNIFIGVAIFIITVCNKKVYKLIKQRFGQERTFNVRTKGVQSSSDTQDSSLSDDRPNEIQLRLITSNKEPVEKISECSV